MLRTMDWDQDFLARSPMFEPLRAHVGHFGTDWPRLAELQHLLDRRAPPACNSAGVPVRLVRQGRRSGAFEDGYEPRLYLAGELQVRERNWHDLFNVLVWLAFPLAKAALNQRHYAALKEQRASGAVNRGPTQDALTLFDEGGVIAASSDPELLEMVQAWRWKDLFWGSRARLIARMRFLLFGHALYEKALRPFIGVTSRGLLLEVEPAVLEVSPAERNAIIDAKVASHLGNPASLGATRELAVLPVLGVPGWFPGNEREEFYDDLDYFRPGRRAELPEG